MSQDLKTQYLSAEAQVNDNRVQVPETIRMKLYGLSKQIKEGDCKMPQPPASNAILRAKWDAWTACQGIPVEKAMQEYIEIVGRLEPNIRTAVTENNLSKTITISRKSISLDPPGGIRKQGTLFKQRDLMKGWRPRHFVLQDNLLSYYLEKDDPAPRNVLDVSGCSVSTLKSAVSEGKEYFPFVITHPKSGKQYHLSSETKLETDIWVAKILEAANITNSSGKEDMVSTSGSSEAVNLSGGSGNVYPNTAHANETRSYIPDQLLPKVEKAVERFMEMVAVDSPGWEVIFEKHGLVAKKRPGALISVRGDLQFPYNLLDIFATMIDGPKQLELDPQRQIHEKIKEFSNHTWADYIRFKGLWPTSPRDFVNLAHWRQFNDGSVIVFAFAEKFDDLRPPSDNPIRAEMPIGGYLLVPNPEGTKVTYVVQTDLKGSLPSSIVNFVSTSQPTILLTMKRMLDKEKTGGKAFRQPGQATTYAELVTTVSDVHYDGKGAPASTTAAAAASVAAAGKAGAAASNNTAAAVPIQKRATLLKQASKIQKVNFTALFILFLPPLLYYLVESQFRAAGFLAGLLVAVSYLIRLHLGQPTKKSTESFNHRVPNGKLIYRFPVEIGKLLVYLEQKREEKEIEMTFTHIAVKAAATAIQEMPSLNGHMIMNEFYLSKNPRVDISLSIDVTETQSVIYKIEDADIKPIEYIADEIITKSTDMRSGNATELTEEYVPIMKRLKDLLPNFLFNSLQSGLYRLGAKYGLTISALGIKRFPQGVCSIITSPSVDGETDVDIAFVADTSESAAPITITMGGIRILPSLDAERKISGSPVLNFAVTMNAKAISMAEGRMFISKVQKYLNDPMMLEKVYNKLAFEREEAIKRKQFFGTK